MNTEFDIAILIPHFNNPVGLLKSLNSITSTRHVFVLIVDDGSKLDFEPSVLHDRSFSSHVLYNKENKGIEYSLNRGLRFIQSEANAQYIARLDCGDLMISNRLDKQYEFLQRNLDVSLVGSWVQFFDFDQTLYTLKVPTEHELIATHMMLQVCLIHPAVMFRTEIIDSVGFYPTEFPAAEDYAFFMNVTEKLRVANISEVLTLVEKNTEGISLTSRRIQLKSRLRILVKHKKFSVYFVLGILKVLTLMILPYSIVLFVKKMIYR